MYSDSPCRWDLDDRADSFTCVSALTARNLLATSHNRLVKLEQIRRYTHPWSCLARCPRDPGGWWPYTLGFPWPPDLEERLPRLFWEDSVPGAAARIATLSLLEAMARDDVGLEPGAVTDGIERLVTAAVGPGSYRGAG
jgi:hypothetical protein